MVILSLSMIYIYICKIAHQMCYNHPFSQRNKVFVEKKENENVDIEHEIENLVMETDEILHETIGKRKINDVTMKFKNVVSITLSEPQLNENSNCSNCQRLVDSIKEQLTDCSSERKIQILTFAPEDWSVQQTGVFQCH